jgi:thioredoxin-related protein
MLRPAASTLKFSAALILAFGLIGADAPPAATPTKGGEAPAGEAKAKEGEAKSAEKVQWLAFDAAVAKAEKEDKHMIVDVYTNWCGWCKVMDRQTYGNAEVAAYLNDHFVLAKVNGESAAKLNWQGRALTEREFARAVGVTGYPSTFFMKPNADLVGGVPGYIKWFDMLIYAKYIDTRYYERGKLQQFADSLKKLGS